LNSQGRNNHRSDARIEQDGVTEERRRHALLTTGSDALDARHDSNGSSQGKTTVWKYLWRYSPRLNRGSIGGVGYNTLIVLGPIFLGRALDATRALEETGFSRESYRTLYLNLALLVATTIMFQGFRTLKRWDFRNMSNRIGNDLRSDLMDGSMSWPMPVFDGEKVGDLMSRAVSDVAQVSGTIMTTVTEIYDTLVLILSYFVACLYYEPRLTLLASIPQVITIFLAETTGSLIFRFSTEVRQAASRVNTHLREQIQAERVLRVFGREMEERERLGALCRQQLGANLRLSVLQGGLMPFYAVLSSLGIVLVIAQGGTRVVAGQWTVGLFTAYLTLFSLMTVRTLMAARVLNSLHAGKAGWTRVVAKIDQARADSPAMAKDQDRTESLEEVASDRQAGSAAPAPAGLSLEVKRLHFSFPGVSADAIAGVSFTAEPGSFVAVTGPIGSGKSALATVLTGLYPYQGSILFDGRELRDISPRERERMVSLLDQNAFLFSATIKENVAFFREARDDRLMETLRLAGLKEDLDVFPNGVDTFIGEQGTRVSGGQRQRVALARALYRGSPLVTLDDPFSAVDIATEQRMVRRIREAAEGSTLVLFSHRLSSFPQADKVIVLVNGLVHEAGTHRELLEKEGLYARIYRAQEWLSEYGEDAAPDPGGESGASKGVRGAGQRG